MIFFFHHYELPAILHQASIPERTDHSRTPAPPRAEANEEQVPNHDNNPLQELHDLMTELQGEPQSPGGRTARNPLISHASNRESGWERGQEEEAEAFDTNVPSTVTSPDIVLSSNLVPEVAFTCNSVSSPNTTADAQMVADQSNEHSENIPPSDDINNHFQLEEMTDVTTTTD